MQTIARPWPRFWARYLDLLLFALFVGVLSAVIAPSLLDSLDDDKGSDRGLSLLLIFLWVPVEALLLSTWGFTPGKAALAIRLLNQQGAKLSFNEALRRSFSVWWRGMACGFPLVNLITAWVAHRRLKKTGSTSWDSDFQISVFQEPISTARTVVVAVVLLFLVLIMISVATLAS